MPALRIEFAEAKLTEAAAEFEQKREDFAQTGVNPACKRQVQTESRFRKRLQDGTQFRDRPASVLPLVHVLDEQQIPKAFPNRGVSNHIGVISDGIFGIERGFKALNQTSLVEIRKRRGRMHGDVPEL